MKLIAIVAFLLTFGNVQADTYSQKMATRMVNILQSKEVQALLSVEDGLGNIQGVSYISSGKAIWGPAHFELKFKSYAAPVPQVCTLTARVDMRTDQLMGLGETTCQDGL